jgi:hypothetical protein
MYVGEFKVHIYASSKAQSVTANTYPSTHVEVSTHVYVEAGECFVKPKLVAH